MTFNTVTFVDTESKLLMPRKRAKPVTTLVPHRSPQLAQLLEAAETCRLAPLRRFLAAGGSPDALVERKFADGTSIMSPLIFEAVATQQIAHDPAMHHASLELLLKSGANANAIRTDAKGHQQTALMAACNVECCTAPVRLLLAHGADPALQISAGTVALHSAAFAGRTAVCKMLLETGACELDVRDRNGGTPLGCAVQEGHLRAVELRTGSGALI
jgi:Ankyrin repeats (3 copies)